MQSLIDFQPAYIAVHMAPWEVSPPARHAQELHLQENIHLSSQTEDLTAERRAIVSTLGEQPLYNCVALDISLANFDEGLSSKRSVC